MNIECVVCGTIREEGSMWLLAGGQYVCGPACQRAIYTTTHTSSGSSGGKSAYEVAVEYGFTGTIEEWLASLVGPASTVPGPAGADSILPGPPGTTDYLQLTNRPTLGTMAEWTPTVSACPATTGTMTVTMGEGARTITPTGACTFVASSGVAGQQCTFLVTTSGTSSYTLTFGTNFRKVGTLATGTVSARFFSVSFVCVNGTIWQEIGRTAAQT